MAGVTAPEEKFAPTSSAVSADGRTLTLASDYQIHRIDNVLAAGQTSADGYDALYAPHAAWVTGDLDVHDVGLDTDVRPVLVNTLFACLATVSNGHSFRPVWTPSFISSLAPMDRCHLNGMAMTGNRPRYVTAVTRIDVREEWRDHRRGGGVVVDVESGQLVVDGLSMPHSARLHDGRLWLVNSGTGELGFVERNRADFLPSARVTAGASLSRKDRRSSGCRWRARTGRFRASRSRTPWLPARSSRAPASRCPPAR